MRVFESGTVVNKFEFCALPAKWVVYSTLSQKKITVWFHMYAYMYPHMHPPTHTHINGTLGELSQ